MFINSIIIRFRSICFVLLLIALKILFSLKSIGGNKKKLFLPAWLGGDWLSSAATQLAPRFPRLGFGCSPARDRLRPLSHECMYAKVFPNTSSKGPNFKGQARSLADKVQGELDHLHALTRKGFKGDFDKQITSLDKRIELIQSHINRKDTTDLDELKEKVENLSTLVHTEKNEKVENKIQIFRNNITTAFEKYNLTIAHMITASFENNPFAEEFRQDLLRR